MELKLGFLQKRSLDDYLTTTEFKYETAEDINQFPRFNYSSSKYLTLTESNGVYTVSISPINIDFNQNGSNYFFDYILKLYNSEKISESEIDAARDRPDEDYYFTYNKNSSNPITFTIKSTSISSGNYYLSASATSNDYQVIDYEILRTILENKEDGGYKSDNSKVIEEKEKKKSKWWISLIVIGGVAIIVLVVVLVKKFGSKKENTDYKNKIKTLTEYENENTEQQFNEERI